MISRSKPHNGIADFAVARRKRKSDFFDAVDKAIDWEPISKLLNKKLNRKANVVGNPAYPALLMFKILLLQKWYKLSDPVLRPLRNSLCRVSWSVDDSQCDQKSRIGVALLRR